MKIFSKVFLALATVFAMSGCVTPYQPKSAIGGFSETRLQEDVFSVSFRGNGYTDRERVSDLAMLRSAELTLENGFKYFALINSSEDSSTAMMHMGGTSFTTGTVSQVGNNYHGNFNTYSSPSYSVPISRPNASFTILCFVERPSEGFVFDAKAVFDSLTEKYNIQLVDGKIVHREPSKSSGASGTRKRF